MDLVIRNARPSHDGLVPERTLMDMADGCIAAIAPNLPVAGAQVYDAGGRLACPGRSRPTSTSTSRA